MRSIISRNALVVYNERMPRQRKRLQSIRRGSIINHTAFGRALRTFLNSDDVFRLLPEGSWTEGGCLTLALTLKKWAPNSHLVAVTGSRGGAPASQQHFALHWEGVYLDGDGIARADELLQKMRDIEHVMSPSLLQKTNIAAAIGNGIPHWKEVEAELLKSLIENFGPFRPELLAV